MNRREAMIKKYGTLEAYREYMRGLGSKGGQNSPGIFASNRALARRAGRLGGLANRGKTKRKKKVAA